MCKRGEVYFVALPIQHEDSSIQAGIRPAIIVQNNIGNKFSPTVIVVPLTSVIKNENQPTHVIIPKSVGLEKTSMVLAEQFVTINKFDIRSELKCVLPEYIMKKVDTALSVSLAISSNRKQVERPDEEYILSIVRDINQLDSKISNNAKENKMMLEGVKIGFIRVLERYCNKFNVDYKNYIRNESVKETQNTIKLAV